MTKSIVCGANTVGEALASGACSRIYVARESKVRGFRELNEAAKAKAVPIEFVPLSKLNELAGTGEHQGVAAQISPLEYTTLDRFLAECPPTATVVLLDRVQHARNLGLIIRTAVGAGASAVVLSARGGASVDDSVVRGSAGTVFRIPIVQHAKLDEAVKRLKDAGFWVYGLDAGATESVFDVSWAERSVLVLGNETRGIRPGLRKACDALLRIPLADDLDSLNVAVAAGVALFQIVAGRE